MTNIMVYTREEVLEHKLENTYCWWDLPTTPRREFTDESNIYFAVNGIVKGSFGITDIRGRRVEFEDWEPLEKVIPQKPFQGYKYCDDLE